MRLALEGLAQLSTGEACLASRPKFDPPCAACHPRGALPVYWACRMFSRLGEWSWCAQAGPDTPDYKKIIIINKVRLLTETKNSSI